MNETVATPQTTQPDRWAEEKAAFAEGKPIECTANGEVWRPCVSPPPWPTGWKYRIKPDPTPQPDTQETPRTDANMWSETGTIHGCCVTAVFSRQLERELVAARTENVKLQHLSQRDGNWLDQYGCCKVCDGEIPHGHTPNCDIYKLEQERDAARAELATVRELNERLAKTCINWQVSHDKACARCDRLEGALRPICDMQQQHYGDGMTTHMKLSALCQSAREALSEPAKAEGGVSVDADLQ